MIKHQEAGTYLTELGTTIIVPFNLTVIGKYLKLRIIEAHRSIERIGIERFSFLFLGIPLKCLLILAPVDTHRHTFTAYKLIIKAERLTIVVFNVYLFGNLLLVTDYRLIGK